MEIRPEVELAAIREQLSGVKETVEEIKVSVSAILAIDRTVAAMKVTQENHSERIDLLSDRIGSVEARVASNASYLNRIKGGIGLMTTILTLIQAAVLTGACWLLSTVIDVSQDVNVMHSQVEYLRSGYDRVLSLVLTRSPHPVKDAE